MTTQQATHQHVWTATIDEGSERARQWMDLHGSRSVPITSPVPTAGTGPDGVAVAAYMLDVARLSTGQRRHIARVWSELRGQSAASVLTEMATDGVPILAEGVSVWSCCGWVMHDHAQREDDPAFLQVLEGELASLAVDDQMVTIRVSKLQALHLMGILQFASKHPGVSGDLLLLTIAVAKHLQATVCPPDSALEKLALMGWVGR